MLPSRIFFDNFFDEMESHEKADTMMKCDIYESNGMYNIEMDIPGFKKEDIHMELNDGYLTISATCNHEDKNKDVEKKYIRRERVYSQTLMRKFYVGDVDDEKIKAEFKDGILLVSVPKEAKEKETKKIINID